VHGQFLSGLIQLSATCATTAPGLLVPNGRKTVHESRVQRNKTRSKCRY